MKIKVTDIIKSMKIPCVIFSPFILVGIIIGIIIPTEAQNQVFELRHLGLDNFISILITNCAIILTVYISAIFTKVYAYMTYAFNGLILGIFVGLVININVTLLWLLLPHGVFEMPCIFATYYIVSKGDTYIRNNFKSFLRLLIINEAAIAICALIENYITPAVANLFI